VYRLPDQSDVLVVGPTRAVTYLRVID
jgi:hypothetical protein